ncbi:putative nucleotidyltransferase with HDIG domain [Geothermobacter ehrlichii]|uniref:Putative nucleotidyltransferase with HDIG domain n=1 Tax=Geothermobacter ehrlichii TaxID=213224 RepID=A0A5D3WIV0_9BACT|nr:HD domain-containing phosphohydrolase [Geothermobacter ehrlichii]TYO98809.1 putative nucleotidyltransferase with HDIG domain [Geothermobacter ehrlichii]
MVAESKRSLKKDVSRLTRVLSTVIKCHGVLVTSKTEDEIYNNICRIVVDDDKYKLAWIGIPKDDQDKNVVPIACKGLDKEYLDALAVHWKDDRYSNGPTDTAIRTGKVQINNDIHDNPAYEQWRDNAVRHGYRSSISIPCKIEYCILCTLNIYSDEAHAFDRQEIELLEELAKDIAYGVENLRTIDKKNRLQVELAATLTQLVEAIALTLEKRDPYTGGHQKRVAKLAAAIAEQLSWSDNRIEGLYLSGLIHDIGKIYIPSEILNRPGPLTGAEFSIIKTHPNVGHEIVENVSCKYPIKEIILQHHERLNGSGYPHGLKQDQISFEARVIAVADVTEAILSHRPYRPALGIHAAMEELKRGRGAIYDPTAVDICMSLFNDGNFQWE